MPRYLSAADIAAAIERDPRTVRRWVAKGRLPRPIGDDGEVRRWDAVDVARALAARGYAVPDGWASAGASAS